MKNKGLKALIFCALFSSQVASTEYQLVADGISNIGVAENGNTIFKLRNAKKWTGTAASTTLPTGFQQDITYLGISPINANYEAATSLLYTVLAAGEVNDASSGKPQTTLAADIYIVYESTTNIIKSITLWR